MQLITELKPEHVSGAENGVDRAEKSDERSGAVSGSRKNERSVEREVAEEERSGERAEFATHGQSRLLSNTVHLQSAVHTSLV